MHRDPGGPAVTVAATSAAPTDVLWALLSTPAWWSAWSPHIRHVTDAGDTGAAAPASLAEGDQLVIHGPRPLRTTAEITTVEAGHRWDFEAAGLGPWSLLASHRAVPRAGGSRAIVTMRVSGPAGALASASVLRAYQPLAAVAVRRLATLAARDHDSAIAAAARLAVPATARRRTTERSDG